jgi:hypothetical protein
LLFRCCSIIHCYRYRFLNGVSAIRSNSTCTAVATSDKAKKGAKIAQSLLSKFCRQIQINLWELSLLHFSTWNPWDGWQKVDTSSQPLMRRQPLLHEIEQVSRCHCFIFPDNEGPRIFISVPARRSISGCLSSCSWPG